MAGPLRSPVVATGKTGGGVPRVRDRSSAATEPGRRDREDAALRITGDLDVILPLRSPVVATGKTRRMPLDVDPHPDGPLRSPVVATGKTRTTWMVSSSCGAQPLRSPVVATGKTTGAYSTETLTVRPLRSPVVATGKTCCVLVGVTSS